MYIYLFLALSYVCIVGWRRNSVGHIMKLPTASPIFRNGRSSISTLLKKTYSSSSLFCISKDIQFLYIMAPCNVPPPPHSSPSHAQPVFPPLLPHNPSVSQDHLPRKWEVLTVLWLLQPPALAKMPYIKNSRMHYASKHLNFK